MIYKLLGMLLILPLLTIAIFCLASEPDGYTELHQLGCCIITALILEAGALGLYLLLK